MKFKYEVEVTIPNEWRDWYLQLKDDEPTTGELGKMTTTVMEWIEQGNGYILSGQGELQEGVEIRFIRPTDPLQTQQN